MPLYEIVKADGSREKVEAQFLSFEKDGGLTVYDDDCKEIAAYAPGTWLEVWRREGVGE